MILNVSLENENGESYESGDTKVTANQDILIITYETQVVQDKNIKNMKNILKIISNYEFLLKILFDKS